MKKRYLFGPLFPRLYMKHNAVSTAGKGLRKLTIIVEGEEEPACYTAKEEARKKEVLASFKQLDLR